MKLIFGLCQYFSDLLVCVQPFHRGELVQSHIAFKVKFCF